jgi:hypothetical protein
MRKGWIVLLTAVLVVAFAAPAMADLKVTGFYRTKAMLSNFFDGGGNPSVRTKAAEQTNAYVEQRARIKFDVGTENARAVIHFESDMNWGIGSGSGWVVLSDPGNPQLRGTRNSGGALSADSVQLETKEVYVWFKIPDTSVQAKVGMQSVNDHYAGIFSNAADMAAIVLTGKIEPVSWTLAWAKLYENAYQKNDDATFYLASAQFVPAKDMTLGVNFYYLQDDTGKDPAAATGMLNPFDQTSDAFLMGYTVKLYMPGVNFAMNAGPVKVSAFGFYQMGSMKNTIGGLDKDISAFALDVRGDLKVGPGNLFVEALYVSGGENGATAGGDYESIITLGDYQSPSSDMPATTSGTGGNAGFGRTNMYFLFGADSLNVSQCLIGCSGGQWGDTLGNAGQGIMHVAAGYSQKFTEKLKGEINVGYLAASKLAVGHADNQKKGMGTEGNVRLDYEIQKGLTGSLVGAVLKMGDYNTTADKVDTYWMGYGRIAYGF